MGFFFSGNNRTLYLLISGLKKNCWLLNINKSKEKECMLKQCFPKHDLQSACFCLKGFRELLPVKWNGHSSFKEVQSPLRGFIEVTKGKKTFLASIVQPFLTPTFSTKKAGEKAAAEK